MNACILYYSLSGNTRRFAEAISDSLQIPVFDLITFEYSIVEEFDILILGTPVHGFSPTRQVLSFVERLPEGNGKKAVIFCTYALRKGNALKKLEKKLANKDYNVILRVSKRDFKLNKQDFSDAIHKIAKICARAKTTTEQRIKKEINVDANFFTVYTNYTLWFIFLCLLEESSIKS